MILRLAAMTFLAAVSSAQNVVTPAGDSAVRRVLMEARGSDTVAKGSNPSLQELIDPMPPEARSAARVGLDALDRGSLADAELADLSRAYVHLGAVEPGARAGLALQERDPKGTQGLVLAASAKLVQRDFAASAALAEQALKIDPGDLDARSVLEVSKGRGAPVKSAGSVVPRRAAGGSNPERTIDDRPLKPLIRLGPSSVPPEISHDATEPPSRGMPWLPYALGGGLTLIGIGLALKHAREEAGEFVQKTEDRAVDGAANLYFKAEGFVRENPKTTIAVGAVGVAVAGWLILPAAGVGGGGMLLATAGGPAAGYAAAGSGISASQAAVVGAAAAVPLLMRVDTNSSRGRDVSPDEPISANGRTPEDITEGQWKRIREVIKRIRSQVKNPYKKDGTPFKNQGPGHLPERPDGYYTEYTVPGADGQRGLERLIVGGKGEMYFSPDHYYTFIPLP